MFPVSTFAQDLSCSAIRKHLLATETPVQVANHKLREFDGIKFHPINILVGFPALPAFPHTHSARVLVSAIQDTGLLERS